MSERFYSIVLLILLPIIPLMAQQQTVTITSGPEWIDATVIKRTDSGYENIVDKNFSDYPYIVAFAWLDIISQVGLFNTGGSKVTMDDFICGEIFPNEELNADWVNKELPNCETYLAIPAAEASILTTPFYSPITRMDILLGGSNEENALEKAAKKEEKAQDKEEKEEEKAEKKDEKAADKEEKKEGKSK